MLRLIVVGLTLLILLQGCGSSGPPQREHFYALTPAVEVQPSPYTLPGALLVMPLSARGFLGGTQIVFRTAESPLQVQRYDNYLWELPPGRAIADALISALRSARLFQYVLSITDRADAGLTINGELTRFEHHPTAPTPFVEAAFSLTLVVGEDRATRFSKTYVGQEPTGQSTPEAMIRAFDLLSARLLAEVVRDLQRLAPSLRND